MRSESTVFVSYSRTDYYFAELLARHLSRRGVPVWLDVKDLTPGRSWDRDLEDALDRASSMVLVSSPRSWERPNVRQEWNAQRNRANELSWLSFVARASLRQFADCEFGGFSMRV